MIDINRVQPRDDDDWEIFLALIFISPKLEDKKKESVSNVKFEIWAELLFQYTNVKNISKK